MFTRVAMEYDKNWGPKFFSSVYPVIAQLPTAVVDELSMLLMSRVMDGASVVFFALNPGDILPREVLGRSLFWLTSCGSMNLPQSCRVCTS